MNGVHKCVFCKEEMKLEKIKYKFQFKVRHRCPKSNVYWHYIKKRYPNIDVNIIDIVR